MIQKEWVSVNPEHVYTEIDPETGKPMIIGYQQGYSPEEQYPQGIRGRYIFIRDEPGPAQWSEDFEMYL